MERRKACRWQGFGIALVILTLCGQRAHADDGKPVATSAPALAIRGMTMDFIRLSAGDFMMGSSSSHSGPVHRVRISRSFDLAKTEVTVAQFRAFVRATSYTTDAERLGWSGGSWEPTTPGRSWHQPGYEQSDEYPAVYVSWNDTTAFCKWLSGETGQTVRLPSEAEWEYACRAGTAKEFEDNLPDLAYFAGNRGVKAEPQRVGLKKPNAWGLYDMHGNVLEWCQDLWHTDFVGAPTDGSAWVEGTEVNRVFRGGAFVVPMPGLGHSTRWLNTADHSGRVIGFRVVREVGESTAPTTPPAKVASRFPGAAWQTRAPDQVGLSAAKLDALRDFAGGRGCVVRHDYLVYTWGDATKRGDVASACKPWFSHFLFKALEDGRIPSLDEKVVKWEPRLTGLNPALGFKDRAIAWRHVANQISCYGIAEAPGAAFDYNDWQMALFFDTLFLKVYGATYENVDAKVLHPLLTDVLQCEDNPTFMAFGTGGRPGRVGVSPRDFCRFGLLYLHTGNWDGRQILGEKHATMAVTSPLPNSIPRASGAAAEMIPGQRSLGSTVIPDNQCDHLGSYSWLWWTNGVDRDGKRHWPDVPADAYGAFGHGGIRAMVIFPSLGLIVSWNDTTIDSREKENAALQLLVESVLR